MSENSSSVFSYYNTSIQFEDEEHKYCQPSPFRFSTRIWTLNDDKNKVCFLIVLTEIQRAMV